MNSHPHFDLVLLITLPDRRKDAVARIHAAGFERLMVIEAFRGDTLPPPSWWRAGNGAWGCYTSHLHALHLAWQSGVESALILEDDVIFGHEFPAKLNVLFENLPADWGQLYLGGQYRGKTEQVNPWVLRPSRVNRTHSYAVSRSALPTILKHLAEFQQIIKGDAVFHIDHHYEEAHMARLWAVYSPSWWLCGQGGNHSMVNGRLEWPRWWHNEVFAEHLPFIVCPPRQVPVPGLHFGYDCADGTWDPWLANKLHDHDKLRHRLIELKHEALRHNFLPAVSHPYCTLDRVASLSTEQHDLRPVAFDPDEILTLTQYPANGLLPTPYYPSKRETVRKTRTQEGEEGRDAGPGSSPEHDGAVLAPETTGRTAPTASLGTAARTGCGAGAESPGTVPQHPGASAAA